MTSVQKGKCNKCGAAWYWCQECGAAGCATADCANQRRRKNPGFFGGSPVCAICGGE